MKLTVVGCSGSYPGPDSAASCYLVQALYEGRTWSLVVDLGNGALGALQRYVELADVDAVALTHLHVDHCVDLASYQVVRTYHPDGRLPALPVYGPKGTAERIAACAGAAEGIRAEGVFDYIDWEPDVATVGPFALTPVRVNHPVETYALRIQHAGRTLVYSADTGPSTALVEVARGADLLLCEASFLDGADNPPELHLTGRQAGEHAAAAAVGRLVLTHIPPWHDPTAVQGEAEAEFAGPVDLARPGATYLL